MTTRVLLVVLFGLLACKREELAPDVVTPTDAPAEQISEATRSECAIDDECPSKQICDGGQCVQFESEPGHAVCGLASLYFAFDSARLTPNNQERLASAAPCLIELLKPGGELLLETYADVSEQLEMLAEHRGSSVREFLIHVGLPAEQLRVVDKSSEASDRKVLLIHVPP
jgi:outer membrane protein OmpA-like peptidoglycan-associated protein